MALLPQDRQSQYMLLITMAMVALGYFFWTYWVQPTNAKIAATRAEADSLQTIVDRAKQDLASGTVDDLRRKVEEYQALLSVMPRPARCSRPSSRSGPSSRRRRRLRRPRRRRRRSRAGRRMNAKLALGLVTLCLAAPLAAQATLQGAPRAPRAKPPASSDTGAHPEAAIAMSLVREVYAYEGGGRDPFLSLLKSGDIRPLLADLKLVGIYYDSRYPARSVAVLRDVTNSKIYRVKPAEIIGPLKVTAIRPRELVFTVQEFGFERQESLQLAKQEVTP